MKAIYSIWIGVLTVSLASACSSLSRRVSPMQQVPSGNQISDSSSSPPTDPRSQTDVDNAMRKRGYKLASFRGERVYCRNEALTGSNFKSNVCLTAKQIEDQGRAGKDILDGKHPVGCLPSKGVGVATCLQ
jgi:hypothetical protein